MGFERGHRRLRELDARLVARRDEVDDGVQALPRHGLRELDHVINAIKEGPILMVLQDPPASFNRVVFAMVGRIVR